ncbi:hypothetical protein NT6N_26180 [Oceaniferula spumae]|uniref:ATP-grasp domain-containing protein n=1 Tax=Oceaniferula spumae TaxID=2979115 RepID=A0AAT9FNP0_9BACT
MSADLDFLEGKIILVGKRKGAADAARRLGLEPLEIDVKARKEQAESAYGGGVTWAVEHATELLAGEKPIAVAAVATGSVVAAAAIRKHFGLPGVSPETAMACHDKLVMKKAISAAGIPCAPWAETNEQTTAEQLIEILGLPLVLKLPISSGGRGVWICKSQDEVAKRLTKGLLAEGFVSGVEMSVEAFRYDSETLLINPTCYLKPRWANVVPAHLAESDWSAVKQLGECVYQALGIDSGISHMEIFLTKNGPVFGEIAARPPGGFLMELIRRAYDMDPWEVLLKLNIGLSPVMKTDAVCHAGVWLIHPEPGTVTAVRGLKQVKQMPGVVHASCRLKKGDEVRTRIGSGETKGRIVVEADSYQSCADQLEAAVTSVVVECDPL